MPEQPNIPRRIRRPLTATVLVAVVLYLGAVMLSDGSAVIGSVVALPRGLLAILIAMPTAGFLLRFVRWEVYLRSLGNHVPLFRSVRVYFAGFALTATPGKFGENLRAMYLSDDGVPVTHSFAAFVTERLSDVIAVLLLSLLALRVVSQQPWTMVLPAAGVVALFIMLRHGTVERWLRRRAVATGEGLGRTLEGMAGTIGAARQLLTAKLLAGGLVIAFAAWGSEAVAFGLLAQHVGVDIAMTGAIGIFAFATLLGAVSFLPGGLGPTEVVLGGALVLAGGTVAEAATITLVIRTVTLWWAMALGILALKTLRSDAASPVRP